MNRFCARAQEREGERESEREGERERERERKGVRERLPSWDSLTIFCRSRSVFERFSCKRGAGGGEAE